VRLSWAGAYRIIPNLDDILAAQEAKGRGSRDIPAYGGPRVTDLVFSEGYWQVRVVNWLPASDNLRAKGLKTWIRARKVDRGVVGDWLVGYAGIPPAVGKRRLEVLVEKKGPLVDPGNINKSLRDSLVWHGLLRDDSAEWLDGVEPIVVRSKVTATTITLTDVA
jgi:hypothetical protein